MLYDHQISVLRPSVGEAHDRQAENIIAERNTWSAPNALPNGVQLFEVKRFGDQRGYFSELYAAQRYEANGMSLDFCQDNISSSTHAGTIRGLHFQYPPYAQDKLVSVLRGAVLDVVIDLRTGSPTFGRPAMIELSAENGRQLFVPKGFAHGFCTLQPDTLIFYKVSAPYAPSHDAGIHWHDTDLDIAWPLTPSAAIVSDKDANLPRLRDLPTIDWTGAGNAMRNLGEPGAI